MRINAGKLTRSQKGVIYGCEGVGKSTFASKFPKPIFVDLEGGTAHLDIQRVAELETWEDFLSTINELIADHSGFQTLVVDTADWAERLCVESLCKKYKKTGLEDFGYGKGYQYLAEEFARMLGKLTALQNSGMHVVVLAHSTIKKLELPEESGSYDHYELKCSKGVSPLLKEWADGLLFANYRTTVVSDPNGKGKAVGGKERVLYTEHTTFCDAKNRWGLSGVLPFEFKTVAKIFIPIGDTKAPESHEDKAWGNVEISDTRKADITLLETSMELSGISEAELNDYFRGKNAKKKAFITEEQTYRDLSDAVLQKVATEESWEKIESQIKNGRAE